MSDEDDDLTMYEDVEANDQALQSALEDCERRNRLSMTQVTLSGPGGWFLMPLSD